MQAGATNKIIGTEALLPSSQPLLSHLLSATLARTVANSGLFYESHLQQFAAGTRTLAQMALEPQARLVVSPKIFSELQGAVSATQASALGSIGDGDAGESVILPLTATDASDKGDAVLIQSGKAVSGLSPSPLPGVVAASPEASHLPAGSSKHTGFHERGHGAIEGTEAQDASGKNHGARGLDVPHGKAPDLAGIHPDAIALVRQQLELLAVPVFRWTGEARPGTPMDWEIHEERDEREAATTGLDAATQTWSTRLVLTLPTLRDVEVRVKLAGSVLQVQLAARENATLALLNENGNELPARLGELGLQLAGLQIGKLAPSPLAQDVSGADDGG